MERNGSWRAFLAGIACLDPIGMASGDDGLRILLRAGPMRVSCLASIRTGQQLTQACSAATAQQEDDQEDRDRDADQPGKGVPANPATAMHAVDRVAG